MSRRFQFSLKWLFVAMLAVGCFFGGIRFERERKRREDEANNWDQVRPPFSGVIEIFEPTTLQLPDGTEWERRNFYEVNATRSAEKAD